MSFGFAASPFSLTSFTFLFYRSTTLGLFLSLALCFFCLLVGKLLSLFVLEPTRTLLNLRLKILTNLLHIGILENAGMTLGGDLHLRQAIEQLLAGHIKFLCQFMYTHARHMVSSSTYPHSRAPHAAAGRYARNLLPSTSF